MNVLVTGHAGYVGGVLADQLAAAGHTVVGFDHEDVAADDVRDFERVGAAIDEADVDKVYHLAAEADVWMDDWQTLVATNVLGTVNVAEAAGAADVPVVFASSVAATGQFNRYGRSKRLAEQAVAEHDHVRTVRFPNVIGGAAPRGQAHDMIAEGLDGDIEVWGNGDIRRSYVDVRDLCRFLRERDLDDVETPAAVSSLTTTNHELGTIIQHVIGEETGDEPTLSLVDTSPPSPQVLTGEDVEIAEPTPLEASIRSQVTAMLDG